MLKELIKLANRLDALGEHDLASELDVICREAAEINMERIRQLMKQMHDPESKDDFEGEEESPDTERPPVPEEKMKKLFPGKKEDVEPGEELSEEDLPDKYLETRVTDIEDYRDPERDLLSEYMEGIGREEH